MDPKQNTPTPAELEILNILWEEQPLSVKDVHARLSNKKNIGYTTALKIMQNMTNKGLLHRELDGRSHLYSAKLEMNATRNNLLNKFLESTFSGSASSLVMQLLGNQKTSQEELDEIKRIIKEMDQNL